MKYGNSIVCTYTEYRDKLAVHNNDAWKHGLIATVC